MSLLIDYNSFIFPQYVLYVKHAKIKTRVTSLFPKQFDQTLITAYPTINVWDEMKLELLCLKWVHRQVWIERQEDHVYANNLYLQNCTVTAAIIEVEKIRTHFLLPLHQHADNEITVWSILRMLFLGTAAADFLPTSTRCAIRISLSN